jgi:Tfp pilus assembly protein PilP
MLGWVVFQLATVPVRCGIYVGSNYEKISRVRVGVVLQVFNTRKTIYTT